MRCSCGLKKRTSYTSKSLCENICTNRGLPNISNLTTTNFLNKDAGVLHSSLPLASTLSAIHASVMLGALYELTDEEAHIHRPSEVGSGAYAGIIINCGSTRTYFVRRTQNGHLIATYYKYRCGYGPFCDTLIVKAPLLFPNRCVHSMIMFLISIQFSIIKFPLCITAR